MLKSADIGSITQEQKDEKQINRARKGIADGILKSLSDQIIKDFRLYDMAEIIERDYWTLQKICKLSV